MRGRTHHGNHRRVRWAKLKVSSEISCLHVSAKMVDVKWLVIGRASICAEIVSRPPSLSLAHGVLIASVPVVAVFFGSRPFSLIFTAQAISDLGLLFGRTVLCASCLSHARFTAVDM